MVLVDQASTGQLGGEAVAEDLLELTLVVVVAERAGVRVVSGDWVVAGGSGRDQWEPGRAAQLSGTEECALSGDGSGVRRG